MQGHGRVSHRLPKGEPPVDSVEPKPVASPGCAGPRSTICRVPATLQQPPGRWRTTGQRGHSICHRGGPESRCGCHEGHCRILGRNGSSWQCVQHEFCMRGERGRAPLHPSGKCLATDWNRQLCSHLCAMQSNRIAGLALPLRGCCLQLPLHRHLSRGHMDTCLTLCDAHMRARHANHNVHMHFRPQPA